MKGQVENNVTLPASLVWWRHKNMLGSGILAHSVVLCTK